MATKTVKVTLTEKNDAGPLFDLFFSLNGGLSYTSSVDSTNLYLPYTGASTVTNVDEGSNAFQLKSKGVCINSVFTGSAFVTPTPTPSSTAGPTPTPTATDPNTQFCTSYRVESRYGGYVFFTNCATGESDYRQVNNNTTATICSRTYPTFETIYGSVISSTPNCGSYIPTPTPTPTPTETPTPTPFAGPTPTPSPTPIPGLTSFGYHSITKSGINQFKCVWSSSSQAYQAYAMIQYLTGQSSPTQSTPYYITAPSVKIWDSLGTERVDINSTGSSTVLWYYDGIQVVVEWNDVSPTGTYANGSTYSDTWGYQKD
jgi:hypothetical protein